MNRKSRISIRGILIVIIQIMPTTVYICLRNMALSDIPKPLSLLRVDRTIVAYGNYRRSLLKKAFLSLGKEITTLF